MSIDFSRLLPLGWSNFFSTRIPLEALPTVGDWVLLAADDPVIVQRLERRRLPVCGRGAAGTSGPAGG